MSVEILTSADRPSSLPQRDVKTSMLRGLAHRCPACGTGPIYRRYLKTVDACSHCGTELHHHRADDAPPYFTIVIVGHVILAGLLAVEQAYAPPVWVQASIWMPLTVIMSLLVLPRIKGALVALQWALRMHGFGVGPDPALPDPISAGEPAP